MDQDRLRNILDKLPKNQLKQLCTEFSRPLGSTKAQLIDNLFNLSIESKTEVPRSRSSSDTFRQFLSEGIGRAPRSRNIRSKISLVGGAIYDREKLSSMYLQKLNKKIAQAGDVFPVTDPIELFRSADPTDSGQYTEWIIKGYLGGGIKRLEDLRSRVTPSLNKFIFLSNKKMLDKGTPGQHWTNQYDLNNYLGLVGGTVKNRPVLGLEDLLALYPSELKVQELSHPEGKVIYENDLATVIQPMTQEAACYYGENTNWCTARRDESNMFAEYNEKGPLKIIIPKNSSYPGEKYQYNHEAGQYMNEKDHAVNPDVLFRKFGMDFEISKIIILNLAGQNLKEIPKFVFDLKNLKALHLDNNELIEIPPEIGNLHKLELLLLHENKLTRLPPEIGNLKKLFNLNLSRNKLIELPPEIGNLSNLKILTIGEFNSERVNLNEYIDEMTMMGAYGPDNLLTSLPPEIGLLHNLKQLYLINNHLTGLPVEIGNLSKLTVLDLAYNELQTVPKEIGQLHNLVSLSLKANKLIEIPPEIGDLRSLQYLDFGYNYDLKSLPEEIGKLQKLTELFVADVSPDFEIGEWIKEFPEGVVTLD